MQHVSLILLAIQKLKYRSIISFRWVTLCEIYFMGFLCSWCFTKMISMHTLIIIHYAFAQMQCEVFIYYLMIEWIQIFINKTILEVSRRNKSEEFLENNMMQFMQQSFLGKWMLHHESNDMNSPLLAKDYTMNKISRVPSGLIPFYRDSLLKLKWIISKPSQNAQ